MKHTDKKSIQILVHTLHKMGLEHVVLSPGSRSAPLVKEFNAYPDIQKHIHFDERCAGFIALGIAQQTKKTVAVFCTSGTAVLNLAPAICEAYYQKVPLLILTADRPESVIGKGENQVIVQQDIFKNYIKKSFTINENDKDNNTVLEALGVTINDTFGPVHINLPLSEPLYNSTEEISFAPIAYTPDPSPTLEKEKKHFIQSVWNSAENRMIICGMESYNKRKNDLLDIINQDSRTIILNEPTANVSIENTIGNIDGTLSMIADANDVFSPDLVITIGRQIISKSIRKFLNSKKTFKHFHISIDNEAWDIFGCLSGVLKCTNNDVLNILKNEEQSANSLWKKSWLSLQNQYYSYQQETIDSDNHLKDADIYNLLSSSVRENQIVQWGNSSPIRYACIFPFSSNNVEHFANRGTSGIDGCLSTAVGAAISQPEKQILVVIGDISFFYDSNALFKENFPSNLKIIVVNNSGGNIFRFIEGEQDEEIMTNYFETKHNYNVEYLAKMHGINYSVITEKKNLAKTLKDFLLLKDKNAILECKTENQKSANFFKLLLKKH